MTIFVTGGSGFVGLNLLEALLARGDSVVCLSLSPSSWRRLREMLFAHPKIVSPRVRFIGFGDDSLTVEVICYSDTGVWAEWHAIREDVFLRIIEIIEASGTSFAFPSKTIYYARDAGLDEERRRAAEQQVREWTEAGELPFPDMSEEQREALAGTLSFPPEGSVEHKTAPEKG